MRAGRDGGRRSAPFGHPGVGFGMGREAMSQSAGIGPGAAAGGVLPMKISGGSECECDGDGDRLASLSGVAVLRIADRRRPAVRPNWMRADWRGPLHRRRRLRCKDKDAVTPAARCYC